jgi:hypothetical protein
VQEFENSPFCKMVRCLALTIRDAIRHATSIGCPCLAISNHRLRALETNSMLPTIWKLKGVLQRNTTVRMLETPPLGPCERLDPAEQLDSSLWDTPVRRFHFRRWTMLRIWRHRHREEASCLRPMLRYGRPLKSTAFEA